MASDIPQMPFNSSVAMARMLVSYIECPHRVHSILRENFQNVPTPQRIAEMRREHLAPKEAPEPIRHNDAYYPADARKKLDAVNREFLTRLQMERLAASWARGVLA